jgi:hypothetical protein
MQAFDSMVSWVLVVGQLWWIPLLLWLLFFFWCRRLAYPMYLERKIRAGKQWIYVPKEWEGRHLWVKPLTVLWLVAAPLLSAATLYFLLPLGVFALVLYVAISVVFGVCLFFGFTKGPYAQQRDYYYQIYRALEEAAYKEGRVMRKNDLQNQCMWQHQNDLRKADKEGKLRSFLKGKATLP